MVRQLLPDDGGQTAVYYQRIARDTRRSKPSGNANDHPIVHLGHSSILIEIKHITRRKLYQHELSTALQT